MITTAILISAFAFGFVASAAHARHAARKRRMAAYLDHAMAARMPA